jgi:hypothetical protein
MRREPGSRRICLGEEQAARRAGGAQLDRHRVEQHVRGEGVAPVAAEQERNRSHPGECPAGNPVKEQLQQPGVGG